MELLVEDPLEARLDLVHPGYDHTAGTSSGRTATDHRPGPRPPANAVVAFVGTVLWGLGMATQEPLIKPHVAPILPAARKATAFGVYDTGHGVFWFAGSTLMGFFCTRSVDALVIFSLCIQRVALPIFWMTYRHEPSGRSIDGQGNDPLVARPQVALTP